MTPASGTRLGHYEILAPLGAGGMGEVYKARDLKLGREVALKLLPRSLARDAQALERFQREARAASALNHPGICTVHDIDEDGGRSFIVMELLEGQTLRQRVGGRPLPTETLLDLAIQLADALDAAHAKGIVHRDVKPGNVFVNARGQVKLMDFGLAKLTHEASGSSALPTEAAPELTSPGTALGTVAYMSPEQVRGEPLDPRSDLFSLGAVLYEMATGRLAFAGATTGVVFEAILNREPPPVVDANGAVPAELVRIVGKALEKDRELRYQSAAEIRSDLKRLRRDSTSASKVASAGAGSGASGAIASPTAIASSGSVRPLRRRLARAGALVALGALLTLAVALALRPPEVPRVTAIRQVTHDRTTKLNVYTDGSRVYYTAAVGGATWLMQAPATGGESVRLETTLRRPRISDIVPDRGELVVEDDQHWFAGETDPVWLVPTVGGSPRSFGEVEGWAGLSADGRHAVYARGRDLLVASGEGLGSRRVLTAPTTILLPRLSPDARRVRYTLESEDWSRPLTRSLWEADVERGTAREILPGWNATGLGWTPDGRSFLFRASRDGEVALWLLPEERRWPWSRSARAPVRLTPGPMEFYASAVSPDGRAVYAVGALPGNAAELVRYDHSAGLFVPFLGGLPASDVAFSRDGRWAAYVLYPEGTLWRSRADGSDRRQLTFAPAQAHLPRWSPDGKTIAYMSQLPGEPWRICLVEAGGGKPRRVATGVSQEMTPDWSRDGTRLVFGGFPPHTPEKPIALSIVDLSTGKVSALPGSEGLYNPLWSPDGQTIAALSADDTRLVLFDLAAGRWRDLLSGSETLISPNFTADGTGLLTQRGSAVIRVSVADGRVEPVASLEGIALVDAGFDAWTAVAPDDSPITLRETGGTTEVYALDVDWP